jgi:hypothetical protein
MRQGNRFSDNTDVQNTTEATLEAVNEAIRAEIESWGIKQEPKNSINGRGFFGHLYGNSATPTHNYVAMINIPKLEAVAKGISNLETLSKKNHPELGSNEEEISKNCIKIATILQQMYSQEHNSDNPTKPNDILETPICGISSAYKLNSLLTRALATIGAKTALGELEKYGVIAKTNEQLHPSTEILGVELAKPAAGNKVER